ncbi:MAG: hypothetical protein QM642_05160 [Edaphocola sp.]
MNRIEQLNTFLAESPNDHFLIHALALEYVKIGDDENAENYFRKNLALDKNYVPTYLHLGKLLERKGRQDAAVAIYKSGMDAAKAVNDSHSFGELRSVYEDHVF